MNILLTSAGRRAYMTGYFKRALQGIGKVHASNNVFTYALQMADHFVITPSIHEESYVDFLINYCNEHDIKAIIPLFDIDLPVLAKNFGKFAKNGIRPVVSDFTTTKICNDKWLTSQFLNDNGFDTPASFISLKQAINAIKSKEIRFPLIINPRWGMGSIGLFQADNLQELKILYAKSKKEILHSYLKYESAFSVNECVIIQQKIDGEEICIDSLNDLDGHFVKGIPLQVEKMRAGESDVVQLIHDPSIEDIANKVSKSLDLVGVWNIDTIKLGGKYYIIDINCRINGLSPFGYIAGANFPKAIINMLLNEPVTDDLLHVKTGVRGFKDLVPVILKQ